MTDFRREPAERPLETVQLLAPVVPGKVICIGRNYAAHAAEHDAEVPALPLLFSKPPSSVIGPGEAILLPPQSQRVEHEAELAVIMGQRARWITPSEAPRHILGYTAANDVSARDLQRSDGQWTRAKGFDTFCPLGPWIETDLDPDNRAIAARVNGETMQSSNTSDMIFDCRTLISFLSRVMTLLPGTGPPWPSTASCREGRYSPARKRLGAC